MIPLLLMLADAPPMTAVDAERAFAADAKKLGQWTAFVKWSADDAVMFVPQPTNAHAFLKDRKDPPRAIDWWPTASYVSCDGKLAVNTGGWKRPDGKVGYFSTVWQRQSDGGWKWIVDGGGDLKTSRDRPASPKVTTATCAKPGASLTIKPPAMPGTGSGQSADGTLFWWWVVERDGSRQFGVSLYDGSKLRNQFSDEIPAPK